MGYFHGFRAPFKGSVRVNYYKGFRALSKRPRRVTIRVLGLFFRDL